MYQIIWRLFYQCCALLCLVAVALSTTATANSDKQKSILVSIPPLALIAQEIYGKEAKIDVLLRGASSPHHSALRLSDKRRIIDADWIYWVGPELENHLTKALHNTRNTALMAALTQASNDPHIWLNPDLAIGIAETMAQQLTKSRPELSATADKRLQNFKRQLDEIDLPLRQSLQHTPPFVVFHDSFNYWVQRYELRQLAALTDLPEESIGLKTLTTVATISDEAQCLLTEPGEEDTARKYAQRLNLPLVTVDILGTQHSHSSYSAFLLHIAKSVKKCNPNKTG